MSEQVQVGDVIIIDHGDGCKTLMQLLNKKAKCCWNEAEIYAENIVDALILSGGCPHYSLPSNYRSGHNWDSEGSHQHIAHIALNVVNQNDNTKIWI